MPNHMTDIDPESLVAPEERDQVRGRAIVVKKYKAIPIEAIVRGYITVPAGRITSRPEPFAALNCRRD